MIRNHLYTIILVILFLLLEVLGFKTLAPGYGLESQATTPSPENTPVAPGTTDSPGIPVTGKREPILVEVVVSYGLIGLTALFLILALLNFANKSTAPAVQHKVQPPDEGQER